MNNVSIIYKKNSKSLQAITTKDGEVFYIVLNEFNKPIGYFHDIDRAMEATNRRKKRSKNKKTLSNKCKSRTT